MKFIVPRATMRDDSLRKSLAFTGQRGSSCRRGRLDYCTDCGRDLRVRRRIVSQPTSSDKWRLKLVRACYYALDPNTDPSEYDDYVVGLKAALDRYSLRERRWMHDSYVQGCDDEQYLVCGFADALRFVGIGADGALLFQGAQP
jgi:hypothetical protein